MDRSSTCWSRPRRSGDAARRFFQRALATLKVKPTEVVTDTAPIYPAIL
jgi:transposase-like protein